MSTVQPTTPQGMPPQKSPPGPSWRSYVRLSRRAWLMVAAGFGAGFLVFLLLWLDMRDNGNFYRAEDKATRVDGQIFEPLPAPMGSGDRSASGLSEAAQDALRNPRPAPPPVAAPSPVGTPVQGPVADGSPQTGSGSPTAPLAPGSVPVAISRPAPRYPSDALRNGESGTVVVRIEVGADGEPIAVSVVGRSGSRSLDRAAVQAAKRWRFRPAQQNGRAVAGAVEVPIEFALDGR
jgi:periplasmic protein TonB